MYDPFDDVVGVVPAAGSARRLGFLPCSKEVFPLGLDADGRPRAVCEHLLESYRLAGIERALVLVRQGKWDVPAHLGSGERWRLGLAYRVLEPTPSVPHTLAHARPFLGDVWVALGFPDILFEPKDAFARLLEHRRTSTAEVILGLFPTDRCEKTDMVELGAGNRVQKLVIKQADRGLCFTWSIALWNPRFMDFLCEFTHRHREGENELWVGNVIQAAIEEGFGIEGVAFPEGSYLDIGTPEDLERAKLG